MRHQLRTCFIYPTIHLIVTTSHDTELSTEVTVFGAMEEKKLSYQWITTMKNAKLSLEPTK